MARRTPPSRLIGSGLIPQYLQDEYNQEENTYATGLAGLGKEESNLFQDYGFAGGVGAGGEVNFQSDPNNRFGKYQQLLQSIGQQISSARQDSMGRGIGKRGLAKARESLIRDMSAGDKSNMINQFTRSASDIFGRRGSILGTRNQNQTGIEGRALDWWNQYGPEDANANVDAQVQSGYVNPWEQPGAQNPGGAGMAPAYYSDPQDNTLANVFGVGPGTVQQANAIAAQRGYSPTFGQPKKPVASLTKKPVWKNSAPNRGIAG